MAADARFLALRDRAYALLVSAGVVSDSDVLTHVYGGSAPRSLHAQLLAPLHGDPRFERRADGSWELVRPISDAVQFTALALATTGASPKRGRIVCVAALAVSAGAVIERFMATVRPDRRVPRYVAERLRLDPAVLEMLLPFERVLDDLVRFLGTRPIVAQDAALAWSFLEAEARRAGQVLPELALVDINALATRVLALDGKPTLARVAARLEISTVHIDSPEEEARVLALVADRVLTTAREQGVDPHLAAALSADAAALRRASTARSLPDRPGVYTMRDAEQRAVYVGKARRLQSRVAAYVRRPLGATRRLEGLVGSVESVQSAECDTDLEALVLEDREIRRLEPRFNTVRQSRQPRLWIRLPPSPARPRAALRRLELSVDHDAPGEYVGPFRNEKAAEEARALARDVFHLDALRRTDPFAYEDRLAEAWRFLHDDREIAESLARQHSTRLLHSVLAFDVTSLLLPADPRAARFVVVREAQSGIEAFLLESGVCVGWRVLEDPILAPECSASLLATPKPRTTADDVAVVLRWLGSQRPPTRVIALPDDPQLAADTVQDALLALWEARAARLEDAFDLFGQAAPGAIELGS